MHSLLGACTVAARADEEILIAVKFAAECFLQPVRYLR